MNETKLSKIDFSKTLIGKLDYTPTNLTQFQTTSLKRLEDKLKLQKMGTELNVKSSNFSTTNKFNKRIKKLKIEEIFEDEESDYENDEPIGLVSEFDLVLKEKKQRILRRKIIENDIDLSSIKPDINNYKLFSEFQHVNKIVKFSALQKAKHMKDFFDESRKLTGARINNLTSIYINRRKEKLQKIFKPFCEVVEKINKNIQIGTKKRNEKRKMLEERIKKVLLIIDYSVVKLGEHRVKEHLKKVFGKDVDKFEKKRISKIKKLPTFEPPTLCTTTSFSFYVNVLRSLKFINYSFLKFDTQNDKYFKNVRGKCSKIINQISMTNESIITKVNESVVILNKCRKKGGKSIYYYALTIICDRIINKASVEVCKDKTKESAFVYAKFALLLSQKFKEFRNTFLGTLYKCCPYAIPWYIVKTNYKESLSDKRYNEMIGYEIIGGDKNGPRYEEKSRYFERMEGLISLYAAFCVIDIHPHPHNIEYAWLWLSRILRMQPIDVTPSILYAFLTVAGFNIFLKYKSQFIKVMNFIKEKILPQMRDLKEKNSSAVTRIEIYCDDLKKNGRPKRVEYLRMPENEMGD